MELGSLIFEGLQLVMREASLFAVVGFLILGASDLAVDAAWLLITLGRRVVWNGRPHTAGEVPPPSQPGAIAIFVPAWDEAAVIGGMLRHTVAAFGDADYRLYVGCYPNDPDTIAAVQAVDDCHVRVAIGPCAGPTSKADCLNRLWERMIVDEAAEGFRFKMIVLHDAEDIVHSAEISLFDSLIEQYEFVQLPVVPLIDKESRLIGGHYLDEFAESHGKEMVVRAALGAGLPSAGVGCAFSRDVLGEIATARGAPFDTDSLTEDYELGLRFREAGHSAAFVRLRSAKGRPMIATKEYFPGSLDAAVAQKSRWMTGIALAGWDRLGWSGGLAERWMRLRDRQSVIAALLIVAAYVAILCWGMTAAIGAFIERELAARSEIFLLLATAATALLLWRLTIRFSFVAHQHGFGEALRSPFRALVGNAVTILAARRALARYNAYRRTGRAIWDKTAHAFPEQVPAE